MTVDTLSRKDIRILLHLIEQGEEAITENRARTFELSNETYDDLRKRLRRIRQVLLSMSEGAPEEE